MTINATGSRRNRLTEAFAAAASKFGKGSSDTKTFRRAKSARAKRIFCTSPAETLALVWP